MAASASSDSPIYNVVVVNDDERKKCTVTVTYEASDSKEVETEKTEIAAGDRWSSPQKTRKAGTGTMVTKLTVTKITVNFGTPDTEQSISLNNTSSGIGNDFHVTTYLQDGQCVIDTKRLAVMSVGTMT